MKKKRSLLTMLTVFILLFYTDMRQVAAMGRSDTFEIDYRPVNATITIDDSNSLFVQFHNDSSTATITGLNVYLTSNRELSLPLSLWQRIEITESSYLLDPDTYDITPNTRYRLRISANDSEVELDPSHEIIIPTGNGVPLPPSDVVISLTENHTVAVSFKPVQFRRGRRKFATDYLVEYTDSPVRAPDEWVKVPVKMNKQKGNKDVVALLPGLDPNITYYLTVKSMCAKNAGAASPVEQFNIGQLNSKRPRVKIVEGTRLDLFPSTDVTLALTCTGSGKSSLPQLSWSLDGVPLVDQQGGYHIYQTAHTLDEKVTSLLKADTRTRSGNFTCVAVNEDGESSATIEVRILGPGSYPADININYGQDGFEMSWQPPIISNGMITAYIIYHTTSENSQLADWHKIQLNATETNVTIPVEHERTDYFFRVQAATGQGPGIISPPFRVKSGSKVRPLNASVVLLNVPSSGSIVDPGTVVEFKCSATGSPLPDLSYYMLSKDGQVDETSSVSIDKNTSQSAESVVIHKELTTSHQIVCVATNSLEKIENRVLVQVKKPGSPPRNVQYTIENESEIQLSWSPPELWNEPITSYKVYLTKDVSEPLSNWLSVVTDLPSILLDEDHLDPESTYYVKISAINDYGEGPSTEHPISFYSPSGGPQDPPRHVVIEFDEANAIMLRWHQPLHPKGKIRFYTIYFTKDPGLSDDLYREWETVTVPGNGNRTTFRLHQAEHNLRPKTLYRVRISASNSMGEGPSTSVTEFETAVAELPVPTDIEVSVDEDNTVHLSFIAVRNPEDHSQIVQDYKVSVSASEDTLNARWHPIEQISTMTDQLTNKVQVAIDGAMLQKNTNYWINVASDLPTQTRVQASKPKRLRTGDGEVTPTVVINEGDYISRDPDVSTSISITCDAEGVPRPRIEWIFDDTVVNTSKFYKIDDVTLDYETNPRSKRSKITMISAVKAGVLTCRAVNNKASTNASITIEIRGPGSPPANVNIYQIRNGFNLSWNEPDIPNGNITKYIIYYTHRNTDDLNDWTTLLLEPNVQTTEIMIDRELTRYRFRLQSISELGPGIISPVYEISSSRKYVPLEVNLHLVEFEGTWMDDETAAEVEPSTEIQFFCQASGNPIPAVTFFWETMEDDDDGLEPGSTSVLLEQRLRHDYKIDTMIASVTTHTSRNLVCRANNTDGVSESKVAIRINKPGGPPTGIKYTISADNNVTLKWLKPDYANGNLTGYNVYLHNNVTTPVELWRRFELDSEETELFLVRGQLKPSSTYYFVLSANNTYGEGPKSRPIEINTATGGPMDAPHHVDIRVDEHNKVKISWKPPHHPNGQLQNYTIYYTRSRVSDPKGHDGTYKKWQVLGISPLVNTYIIDGRLDGLLPHEQYRLMMSATNDLSEGPPTKVYKFRTRSGVAGKPSNISIVQQFAATVISFDRLYDTRGATPVWIKKFRLHRADGAEVRDETEWTTTELMDVAEEGAAESRLEIPHTLGYFHSHSYWIRLQGVTDQGELGEMSLAIRFTFLNGHSNGDDNGRKRKIKEPPL